LESDILKNGSVGHSFPWKSELRCFFLLHTLLISSVSCSVCTVRFVDRWISPGRQWNGCPVSLPEANPYFCLGLEKSEFEAMYSTYLFIRVCSTTLIYLYELQSYVIILFFFQGGF